MSPFGFFGDKAKNASIGLTESGKRRAENIASGGVEWLLLAKLAEKSPMSVNELAREIELPPKETDMLVQRLKKRGFIRFVGDMET